MGYDPDQSINRVFIDVPANTSIFQKKIVLLIPILVIILAEAQQFSGNYTYAFWLYIMILIALCLVTIFVRDMNTYAPYQALMLLPLLRLVSISMPVFFEMTLYSFIFIYLPLIIPLYFIAVHQKFNAKQIGFNNKKLLIYIPAALIISVIISAGEYYIVRPDYLIPDLSFLNLLKLSIIMFMIVGVIEELIFRSILQTRLEEYFGLFFGLIVTSILFGVMHSGYGAIYEILFTCFAGLIIGYLFQRTRCLLLIVLIHGSINVLLFGVMPYVWDVYNIDLIIARYASLSYISDHFSSLFLLHLNPHPVLFWFL